MNFDEIQSLREAIKASPDSIPLRKLLSNALMKNERWEEAEIEIKEALRMAPNDLQIKIALAQTFYELGKISVDITQKNVQTENGVSQVFVEDISFEKEPTDEQKKRLKEIATMPAQIIAINLLLSVIIYITTIFFVKEIFTNV